MKLLVLDVEGTLFRSHVRLPETTLDSTIWQALALALGTEAVKAETESHHRWERGSYPSYLEWMKDTIRIHRKFGLTKEIFLRVIEASEYQPGVLNVLRSLDRTKFEPVLITGGFRELACRVQIDCQVLHAFAACEYLFGGDGHLAAFNLLPCDFSGKLDFVRLMLREYGLREDDWIFVGDGLNDVAIANQAPLSIGFQPHPDLAAVVSMVAYSFTDIPALLESF
jgi:phosphoserine phosphatase